MLTPEPMGDNAVLPFLLSTWGSVGRLCQRCDLICLLFVMDHPCHAWVTRRKILSGLPVILVGNGVSFSSSRACEKLEASNLEHILDVESS